MASYDVVSEYCQNHAADTALTFFSAASYAMRLNTGVLVSLTASVAAKKAAAAAAAEVEAASSQGLTLVHVSAQLVCFLWHRECIQGVFRGCLGGV
jgi:hypothetical protein